MHHQETSWWSHPEPGTEMDGLDILGLCLVRGYQTFQGSSLPVTQLWRPITLCYFPLAFCVYSPEKTTKSGIFQWTQRTFWSVCDCSSSVPSKIWNVGVWDIIRNACIRCTVTRRVVNATGAHAGKGNYSSSFEYSKGVKGGNIKRIGKREREMANWFIRFYEVKCVLRNIGRLAEKNERNWDDPEARDFETRGFTYEPCLIRIDGIGERARGSRWQSLVFIFAFLLHYVIPARSLFDKRIRMEARLAFLSQKAINGDTWR